MEHDNPFIIRNRNENKFIYPSDEKIKQQEMLSRVNLSNAKN